MDQQISLLKQFVTLCKTDPSILHQPNMAFYREYLESLGASVPPPRHKQERDSEKKVVEEENEKEEMSIPSPKLDSDGVIPPDFDTPLPMGDPNKEVTDEDIEKANENRDLASSAFSKGDYAESVEYYTKAIELNPGSAILHAKRAYSLIMMNKPVAAIRDCDHSISINPDSAQGYKFRGRANRLLGNWLMAYKDLAIACKLDFDDTANGWLKEVEPNAKKIQEYNRAKERKAQEKEMRERRERVQQAQENSQKTAQETKSTNGTNDDSFGMGGFAELFKEFADDPELLKMAYNDPTIAAKLTEIMQNPENVIKYMDNPAIQLFLHKFGKAFGAAPHTAGGNASSGGDNLSRDAPRPNFADDVD